MSLRIIRSQSWGNIEETFASPFARPFSDFNFASIDIFYSWSMKIVKAWSKENVRLGISDLFWNHILWEIQIDLEIKWNIACHSNTHQWYIRIELSTGTVNHQTILVSLFQAKHSSKSAKNKFQDEQHHNQHNLV